MVLHAEQLHQHRFRSISQCYRPRVRHHWKGGRRYRNASSTRVYTIFFKNKRLSAVRAIHGHTHWEIARGSTDENIKYCSKDGDFHELGERYGSWRGGPLGATSRGDNNDPFDEVGDLGGAREALSSPASALTQVMASHSMIDYINNYFALSTLYTAIFIELIQYAMTAASGNAIQSNEKVM